MTNLEIVANDAENPAEYHLRRTDRKRALCGKQACDPVNIRSDAYNWLLSVIQCDACLTILQDYHEGAAT